MITSFWNPSPDTSKLALREGWFSGPGYDKLVESTVSGTIQYVCKTFKENCYLNPSFNEDTRSGFILQQLYGLQKCRPSRKNTKKRSQCVSSLKWEKRHSLNFLLQSSNLHTLQSSLDADLANISKFQHQSNDKQQSFAYETLDSFKMKNSSTTTTQI